MMKRWLIAFLLMYTSITGMWAQHLMQIVEWNIENAFDTKHDEGKNDWEFLPEGSHRWTKNRYWKKLDEIAKTIVGIGDTMGLPPIVGLCEVENDTVMTDLTTKSILYPAGYKYIITNSPDRRGIDAALLFRPAQFQLLTHHSVRVPSEQHKMAPTRDILYAKGRLISGDTLHVIVCHLPSKTGGLKNSNKHRNLVVKTLRNTIDSVFTISPQARLIVMGDFNATPREAIFKQLCPPLQETLPTSRRELNKPIGTYYFQNLWSYLDHILVSPNIITIGQAHEVKLPHLLETDGRPRRTFRGPTYNGGVSDHLPLVLKIIIE